MGWSRVWLGSRVSGPALVLIGILVLAAALRLWVIGRSGFGTDYYAAGVLSMMASPHNFFFAAFDPAGFVSIDKPPVALWIQVLSAEIFGFSGFSVILPQVLEGLAAILLLYRLVARRFGPASGLLAAAALAITPVSVAVDRSSNTDSCLVLVLLIAAAATIRAIERQSAGWLLVAMGTIGIGFNVKMAAALGVVPAFAAAYLLAAPQAWRRRLMHLAATGIVALVVGFSWFAAYDLVPPDQRPYAGSTRDNSMLEMVFVQYGIDRFIPHPGRGERRVPAAANPAADGSAVPPAGIGMAADHVPAGPLRFAAPLLGGQIGWFFPIAGFGLAASFRHRRRPETPAELDLVIWAGWALAYGAVFSFAGGIFHAYYVVAMAPPVAALTGIGLVALWRDHRAGRRWALPVALAATALWQAWLDHGALEIPGIAVLFGAALTVTLAAAVGLAMLRRPVGGLVILALAAITATPFAWALSPVLGQTNVSFPAADLALLRPTHPPAARRMRSELPDPARLIDYVRRQPGATRYLLATQTATVAAPLILASGAPVMATGGYSGSDPIMTPELLAGLVEAGSVRFFLLREGGGGAGGGRGGGFGGMGRDGPGRLIADWVRTHGTPVDPAAWGAGEPPLARDTPRRARFQLYDLKPAPQAAG